MAKKKQTKKEIKKDKLQKVKGGYVRGGGGGGAM